MKSVIIGIRYIYHPELLKRYVLGQLRECPEYSGYQIIDSIQRMRLSFVFPEMVIRFTADLTPE